jgi:hypothetical protein
VSGRETVPSVSASGSRFRGRVVILRHGSLELPVDIDLYDAAGNRQREHWDGRGPLHVIEWHGASALTHAVVDPEHRVLIDDDLFNNAATRAPTGTWRSLERSLYVAQLALGALVP